LDLQRAGELVQRAVESEVLKLAEIIQQYARGQVSLIAAENDGISQGLPKQLRDKCMKQALDCNRFMEWLTAERPDACGGSEAIAFYSTFFRTQLCLDFLSREIVAQTAAGQNI